VLDVEANQREEGSAAVVALGVTRGANIVRVHDVCATKRIVKMTDAMLRV
jgi:dihydropteroate synthase